MHKDCKSQRVENDVMEAVRQARYDYITRYREDITVTKFLGLIIRKGLRSESVEPDDQAATDLG